MIDFNTAPEQKDGNSSAPIPPGSVVWVRMEIRQPSSEKELDELDVNDPKRLWVTKSGSSNNHFHDCEFEVLSPSFEGKRIWQNFTAMGSPKACNITGAFLRAVLEASRGIMPNDSSPNATQARQIEGYESFNGLEFPVVVGVQKIRPGDKYINNNIVKVITPDMEDYAAAKADGEIISDKPVPELPQAGQGQGGGASRPAAQGAAPGMPASPARTWGRKS